MSRKPGDRVAFVCSYTPRKCGIATFTSDLIENTALAAKGDFEPLVVAMRAENNLQYKDPVKFEIRQDVQNDYICALYFSINCDDPAPQLIIERIASSTGTSTG